MKKLLVFLTSIFLFFLIPLWLSSVFAANFEFDQTSVNVSNNQTFNIAVTLNPGSDSIYSTDIYLVYDATILKPTNVAAGSLFPTVSNDLSQSGKVYIAAMVNDPTTSVSSSGTVATVTFQALKEGTTNLTFDCSSSKIIKNDANGTNVIVCSQNGTSSIVVGSSEDSNSNNTTLETNNNQTTELPKTGILEDFLRVGLPGLILVLTGIFLKISLKY